MELYYYTTTDTLRFILEKGNIYATNIRYMNDSEEYINGVNELWTLINNKDLVEKWLCERGYDNLIYEELKSQFTKEALEKNKLDAEFYSISFCQKNDLLSQWAIYARESGVSIKMNFDRDSYFFWTESTEAVEEKEKKLRAQWQAIPQEVCYFTHGAMRECPQEYENRARDILDRLYQQSGADPGEDMDERWKYTSAYIKRYDFYQEAESRLIFQPRQAAYPPKIQYRCDKKVLKPYLDIECGGGWPIWEIMIGPGFNQEVVYNSVIHFVDNTAVKNGVTSARDYVQRVKSYFKPFMPKIEEIGGRLQLSPLDAAVVDKMELSEIRIELGDMVHKICEYIHSNGDNDKSLQKYVEENHFTESGIVVSKSSIPYLF